MQRIGLDARALGRGLGIATFVAELASRLSSMPGREVVLFGPGERSAASGARRIWPPMLRPYIALDSPVGRAAARRAGVDVMHFTANSGWWRPGTLPFVLTIHDVIFMTRGPINRSMRQHVGHAYWRRAARSAAVAASAVACPSHTTAAAVQRAFELPHLPAIIPNGVHVSAVVAETAARPYVLAFGSRDPRKRVDLALDGWRRAGLDLDMHVLAGAGLPPGFGVVTAEELAGRLHVLGYLSRQRLDTELARAVALVYPSEAEGFGLPIIEAMACGTPVVTGLCSATREIAGDAAIRIDSADPAGSIAAALRRLVEDTAYADDRARAARARAAEYDWDRCAESYAQLYDAVLAR